ncbi:MAG TPA: PIN domain-containing protein [Candidatus Wallbacteria bacterium]|nr:PIN domain-containing protein [Candidatus Wallbacteria bacterium]
MILVDTNVIINYWRRPTQKIEKFFLSDDIAICGVTKSELIYGAKNEKEIESISEALSDFIYIEIDDIWEDVGRLLFELKTKGVTIPFQDAIICSLALKNDLKIWSDDKHFKLVKKVIPELELFEETR